MELIYFLLSEFYKEEKINIILIILTSFIISILQTNGISYITANIINYVKSKSMKNVIVYYQYFVYVSILFIVLYGLYRHFYTVLSTKIRQWIRNYMLKMVIVINTHNFTEQNFLKFSSPITRISYVMFGLFNDVIAYFLPNLTFIIIVSLFFLYKNLLFGLFFFISNILLILYLYLNIDEIIRLNDKYENTVNDTELYLLEILSNMDKIVYKGQSESEIKNFTTLSDNSTKDAYIYNSEINFHNNVMGMMIYLILFISIAFIVHLTFTNQIDNTIFITFFTILLLYREKITSITQQIPDFVEFSGRVKSVIKLGNNISEEYLKIKNIKYATIDIPFNNIYFDDVSYKYKTADKPVFEHLTIDIETDGKIIGITGLSGNGKSSFAKMMVKMYRPDSGNIYIDDININDIDTEYIRKNIVYVNQSFKLFDKNALYNVLYGCTDAAKCKEHLEEVFKYPKIVELYKNVSFDQDSESMGEKLSGGQKQILNVISGLVNPSKILILDEPTNALDIDLKKELLAIIRDFKKHKKCIIIITHDRDAYHLFDDEIKI
jgi:ABC-type multidrug transport system fused ATPase/permease subunit